MDFTQLKYVKFILCIIIYLLYHCNISYVNLFILYKMSKAFTSILIIFSILFIYSAKLSEDIQSGKDIAFFEKS